MLDALAQLLLLGAHQVICARCGRESHLEPDCYATFDVDGFELSDVSDSESDSGTDDDCCFRCGREGHWSSNCYSRTDVHGKPL